MPNLLNPAGLENDRYLRGLLNFGTAFATGGPGVPGDLGQGAQDLAVGLLNARQQSIDPTGRVRAMSGQHGLLQGPQVPFSSEALQSRLGGDPSAPESLLGFIGAPDVTDVGKIAAAAAAGKGGLLAQALFHGTPHKFDVFDLNKIGTGEGAQAYGHGLYFAENPGVARSYVTAGNANASTVSATSGQLAQRYLYAGRNDPDEAVRLIGELRDEVADFGDTKKLAEIDEAVSIIRGEKSAGHLYEVDIPDETIGKMLDWDAPLSEQPQVVKDAIANNPEFAKKVRMATDSFGELKGEQIYEVAAQLPSGGMSRSQVEASNLLNEAGIPGIRFLDGSSRKAGEGTRNIVVFNPDDIREVKRDGELVHKKGLLGK